MMQYYTAELAARVTAFFASDLELFAYPRWEPSQQMLAPSPGPDMSNILGVGHARCVCGVGNNTVFQREHMLHYVASAVPDLAYKPLQ